VGIFGARVAVIYAEVEGFALVEGVIGGGDGSGGSYVIDFDLSRLLSDSAVFVGNSEVDIIGAVIDKLMGDILTDYRLTVIA
jgi:hypothetical protein